MTMETIKQRQEIVRLLSKQGIETTPDDVAKWLDMTQICLQRKSKHVLDRASVCKAVLNKEEVATRCLRIYFDGIPTEDE